MYFTIPASSPSTIPLSADALGSYERLRTQAATLGGLSASFTSEARAVTEAYVWALSEGSPSAWRALVLAADTLARHAESVDWIVHLDVRERAASAFFAQIVRENSDLLLADAAAA